MSAPFLATKLFIPPPRPGIVPRPRLVKRLDSGGKLTLISAPAGFGKTTLVSEWLAVTARPAAWLSLDEGDNDPTRFLIYLIAAMQTVAPQVGAGVLEILQKPQPPPSEPILVDLLNEIAYQAKEFVLVLDDLHTIDKKPGKTILGYLIEHLPPSMRLVIATREDPVVSLSRYRARGQLSELRTADLRFTPAEAADFLKRTMGLNLREEDIAALEARTEGWAAGLQLAAISMQGHSDAAGFIQSFSGSHRFIMDYLVEEVLQQQTDQVQSFLLRTSILSRMCGSLCEAVLQDPTLSGQEILEYLERANLFIVPLDNERLWYRYHHLFAGLLRKRLQDSRFARQAAAVRIEDLHLRASQWYEAHGLGLEAFQHAAAANDIDRADRLIDQRAIPFHYSGSLTAVLDWLDSLPTTVLNTRPHLWWRHASLLLINGQTKGVEEKLLAAEQAIENLLQGAEPDGGTCNLIGQIAAGRATLALTRYQAEDVLEQSRRALQYLAPESLFTRASANWTLGYAHFLLGDRGAARQALLEGIALSQQSGAVFTLILNTIGLGNVQEADNQLYQAAETYQRVIQLAGDRPQQIIHEAHLGLARIHYEWNDLEAATEHAEQALQLARQYERVIDRFLLCQIFLARLQLARGQITAARDRLAQAEGDARQGGFPHRLPEIAASQVLVLLHLGKLDEAARLALAYPLPLSQARVHLAQGDATSALEILARYRQRVEAQNWQDERLKVLVLQAVSLQAKGEVEPAIQALSEALALAEPEGITRTFIDEGAPMEQLLALTAGRGILPGYINRLLAHFPEGSGMGSFPPLAQPLPEPLSPRELEILRLIAEGLSNQEISQRLFLALNTVKGYNRKIFNKLHVRRRTEAVARARELHLL